MKKLRVTAVSYLNTKPFLYGIFKNHLDRRLELQLDIPSECARKLASGEAELGLIPVAAIPEVPTPHLISDYCIGADGPVRTVCLYGDRPIEEWKGVYLDYHSRTSVELTRILLEHHWQLTPELLPARPGYEVSIGGERGGLVIGDRAIGLEDRFPYCYDLGEHWRAHTGLPFVFAAWISTRPIDPAFLAEFNAALRSGLEAIPELMYLLPTPAAGFDLQAYFTNNISYPLDEAKKQALGLFLETIQAGEVVGIK